MGADGKQLRKSIYGKGMQEVAKKLTKALNDINLEIYVEPSKLTIAPWLDTWVKEYIIKGSKTKKG